MRGESVYTSQSKETVLNAYCTASQEAHVMYNPHEYTLYDSRFTYSPSGEMTCPSPDCVVQFPAHGYRIVSPVSVPMSTSRYDQLGYIWQKILDLCAHFGLQRQTAHLARMYAGTVARNRFLLSEKYCYCVRSREDTVILRQKLELIATTCVFMAAKIEEVNPPKGSRLSEFTVQRTGFQCTVNDLIRNEMKFLTDLDWNMHLVTPYSWIVYLLLGQWHNPFFTQNQMQDNLKILNVFKSAIQVMDIAFMDAQAWSYLPSILAGGALLLVDAGLALLFVAQFLHVEPSLLYECVVWLRSLVADLQEWECQGTCDTDRWSKISISESLFIQHRVGVPPSLHFGLLQSRIPHHMSELGKVRLGNGYLLCTSPCSSDYCMCTSHNGAHSCDLSVKCMESQVYHCKYGWQGVPSFYDTFDYPNLMQS